MTPVFYRPHESGPVAQFVAESIPGCERGFGPCVAMGVFDKDDLVGGVVFHNWNPESGVMEMSGAATSGRWLTRPVLWAMHEYIFETAQCQLAIQRVSEKNKRMLRIATAYGYEKHLIPRLRGRDEAECIMTLTDDDWRASKFHKR